MLHFLCFFFVFRIFCGTGLKLRMVEVCILQEISTFMTILRAICFGTQTKTRNFIQIFTSFIQVLSSFSNIFVIFRVFSALGVAESLLGFDNKLLHSF